jgi:phage terminase large subunit
VSSRSSLLTSLARRERQKLRSSSSDPGLTPLTCDDPVVFAETNLGLRPWSKQAEVMRAIAVHKRVAVRSGHKIGKSTLASAVALWWGATKPRGRVVMTAPTARQVEIILWKEVRRLYREAKIPIGGDIHESPGSGLVFPDGREVLGFSTNEPERMAGISGPNVLFIVDEGSGVEQAIFEAIEGNRAGGASLLMLGNPTQTSGEFFEAFTSKRQFWVPFHVSSEETPNAVEGRDVVPGLATREWIEEKRAEWGEDSPLFQVRVRGNFPTQVENAVVGLALIENAVRDHRPPESADGRLCIGVDVARYGDDETAIQPVRGLFAYPVKTLRSMDGVEVAEATIQVVRALRVDTNERPVVKVDVIGVGASAYDHLKHFYSSEIELHAVNVAESATDETCFRLRDQLWFAIAVWLKEGGKLPRDERRDAELVAARYKIEVRGRRQVESKDELKKRLGGKSPDRADALGLALFTPALVEWREIPADESPLAAY